MMTTSQTNPSDLDNAQAEIDAMLALVPDEVLREIMGADEDLSLADGLRLAISRIGVSP